MYDEFDKNENEDRYEPQQPLDAQDTAARYTNEVSETVQPQGYTEETEETVQPQGYMEETEETVQPQGYAETAQSSAQQPQGDTENEESASTYHYSYEKGEQAETTGSSRESGYRQYYKDGAYHQRETGWHDGVYQKEQPKRTLESGGKKKKLTLGSKIAICAGCAVLFGMAAGLTFAGIGMIGQVSNTENMLSQTEQQAELQTEASKGEVKMSEGTTNTVVAGTQDVSVIAENAMPSIVAITNKGVEEVQSLFFGTTQYQETESAGSGVIIAKTDKELLIATNNHVVDGAEELSVCFTVEAENKDDAVVKAQVKGTDSDHDLAVVAVNLSDVSEDVQGKLKVAVMGDSDALKIGNQVIAIGNALGYGQSLTVGYVSALNREVTIDNISNNMIQTDAAINFGNSGGALLDMSGNLIGINSAKAADTGVEGMGYALPINTASPILDELMNRTTREKVADSEELGFLGVDPRDVSEEARQIYNLPAGAFVYSVVEGSPAEKAGIKKGDIITKLDGITISSRDELFSRMEYYKAGETIDVVVKTAEGGNYVENTFSVTLGKKSEYNSDSSDTEKRDNSYQGEDSYPGDGQMEEQPRQYYDYEGNGGSGNSAYDSLEEFFRQFQQ